ncbi:hypothetical protein [Nesterenkonia pannonica]|uniref:hypothetical protein n=1 Tax=Nesterenkonia pannonica TaxID=1548602 RepID=UPI002164733C|nr:hypothetical protein [Nesterenkonia pannonica]
MAGYFARTVVTPVKERVEDLEVLAVVKGPDGDEVILPATSHTVVDGVYGLFFHGGRGFARVGRITSFTARDGTLARKVEHVAYGDLRTAVRGWWSANPHLTPQEAGFEAEEVVIELPDGPAPAWYVLKHGIPWGPERAKHMGRYGSWARRPTHRRHQSPSGGSAARRRFAADLLPQRRRSSADP